MKAVVMTAVGPANVLEMHHLPIPTLTADRDVLVNIRAAGVNPVDTKLRGRGTYYPDRFPAILGCDGAGIVTEVGSGVSRWRVGDEVYYSYGGIGGESGNYAEYSVIHEAAAGRKPPTLSFAEAAAAPLVLITAWEALFDRMQIGRGQTVLIHAGAGGVGHVAIQLAKIAGARVITTVSTHDKAQFVTALGADHVIVYAETDFVHATLQLTESRGVDGVLDTVGGDTFVRSLETVRFYGDIVSLLQPPDPCNWKAARLRNLRISLELMLTPQYQHLTDALTHHGEILERCAEYFARGDLKIHVQHTLPLAQASEAHQLIERGHTQGKIVLHVSG